ncbi:hypothetical protein DL93DRAFT_2092754 [Clavulina sp. PMI_390]|nr:hypothetical protein DL93DRAFT_2092754 [Clavulina sp. PMI_390]
MGRRWLGFQIYSLEGSSIQAHLYDAFLHHETCDISLVCVGTSNQHPHHQQRWTASYESHRVILIQAGYFKSLFTSGFSETQSSSPKGGSSQAADGGRRRGYSYAELDVRLRFDDPNITRAALYLADDLHSTVVHPLTRSFPLPPSSLFPSASASSSSSKVPSDQHPATPRFLLSLLATATYLGMPSVASEALGLIMLSIGPWTVTRYLNFALGKGIGLDADREFDDAESAYSTAGNAALNDDILSAKGLEHVAQDVSVEDDVDRRPETPLASAAPPATLRSAAPSRAPSVRSHRSVASRLTATVSIRSRHTPSRPTAAAVLNPNGIDYPSLPGTSASASLPKDQDFEVIEKSQGNSSDEDDPTNTPPDEDDLRHRDSVSDLDEDDDEDEEDLGANYFYGAVGNQIGEACACWLSRWSRDVLEYEEAVFALRKAKIEEEMRKRHPSTSHQSSQPRSPLSSFSSPSTTSLPRFPLTPLTTTSDSFDPLSTPTAQVLSALPILSSLPSSSPSPNKGKGPATSTPSITVSRQRSDLCIWGVGGLSPRWIRGTISSDAFFIPDEMERYRFSVRVYRLRQAMKEAGYVPGGGSQRASGMQAHSSTFAAKAAARATVRETQEWDELFRTGIYYTHMSFSDLRELEVEGFVPNEVLTLAHWAHSVFKNAITSARPGSGGLGNLSNASSVTLGPGVSTSGNTPALSPTTPGASGPSSSAASTASQPRELGLTYTTAEIKASLDDQDPLRAARAARKTYFPVLADGSARYGDYLSSPPTIAPAAGPGSISAAAIGDLTADVTPPDYSNSPLFAGTINGLPSVLPSGSSAGARPGTAGSEVNGGESKPAVRFRTPAGENEFFGLGMSRKSAQAVVASDPSGQMRWTEFSAEWWGAQTLKEKARLYSVTIPYAGSLFNVYVQVVRKKGLQLGLYLHRQSMVDPVPTPSLPPVPPSLSIGPARTPSLQHSQSLIFTPRASAPHEAGSILGSSTGPIPMQISTRVSHFTGAVSSSPPTPSSGLAQLPGAPRVGSPPMPRRLSTTTNPSASVGISTTYTTYYRSSSPPSAHHPSFHSIHPAYGPGHGHGYSLANQGYRDPRTSVRAYFSIACPSASGTSMTVFRSVPDDFAIDGSWGWRSSACVEIPSETQMPAFATSSSAPTTATRARSSTVIGAGSSEQQKQSTLRATELAAVQQWLRELTSVRAMVVIGVV